MHIARLLAVASIVLFSCRRAQEPEAAKVIAAWESIDPDFKGCEGG